MQSRSTRPDSTGFAPKGERTPRGETPRRSSRGGRPECTGRHRKYNDSTLRDEKGYALRDSFIEAAFKQPLDLVRGNSVAFVEAVIHVLRKHGGVQTDNDYVAIMNDIVFEPGSKHFSYVFRRSRLPHEDGSLCLNELFNHGGTTRKIREMPWCIYVVIPCNSNKSRVQIGLLTRAE